MGKILGKIQWVKIFFHGLINGVKNLYYLKETMLPKIIMQNQVIHNWGQS